MQDQNNKSIFPTNDAPPFSGSSISGVPNTTVPSNPLATPPLQQNLNPVPAPVEPLVQSGTQFSAPMPATPEPVPEVQPVPVQEPVVLAPQETIQPLPVVEPVNSPLATNNFSQSIAPPLPSEPAQIEKPIFPIQSMPTISDVSAPPAIASMPTQPQPFPVQTPNEEPLAQIQSIPESAVPAPVSPPEPPLAQNHFPPETVAIPQQAPVVPTIPMGPIQPPPTQAVASVLTPSPIMASSAQQPPAQPVPMAAHEAAPAFIQKKSTIPKFLLFGAIGLLLLSLLVFVVMRVMGGGNTALVGTKGEITWWGVTVDEEIVIPLIEEYEASHPGTNITYVKQSEAEYRERLTNALASGKGPDIYEFHNSWVPMFRNDLSPIPSNIMSADEYKNSFYPVYTTDLTTTKGIVGMPLEYDAITLYVNEDIFSSALKIAPKTWNDVKLLADPLTGLTQKDEGGRVIQSGLALGITENIDYWPEILSVMMYQNNASFSDLASKKTKDVLSFYNYFKQIGAWDVSLPKSTSAFAKERTAMIFAPGRAAYSIIQEAPNLRFKTYPVPQLEKEVPTQPNVTYATYWVEGVWARSANSEASWEFLKFMSTPSSLQKINENLKSANNVQRVYPRQEMNLELANDPILGSIVTLAPSAKTWYLADKTNDGATGLNTLLKNAFAKALSNNGSAESQAEVVKILTQYGIPVPK